MFELVWVVVCSIGLPLGKERGAAVGVLVSCSLAEEPVFCVCTF